MENRRENIRASLLDRLLDYQPKVKSEPVQFRFSNISQMKASLTRDLENLLNTRRLIITPPGGYKDIHNSLFTYGIKDFTSENPKSTSVQQKLRQEIKKALSRFEPRLKNVNIDIETSVDAERKLKFRITGLLFIDPVAEPVTFDTYFDVNRNEYFISQ